MNANDRDRKITFISDTLEDLFGVPIRTDHWKVIDLLIETILSQNTNDRNRDKAFHNLISIYPTWDDVLIAETDAIADAIRIAGLAPQKSQTIKRFLTWLKTEKGELDLQFLCEMPPEKAKSLLCEHKGIGLKTASVTLAFACGHELFPVDTHILRISKRLGLIDPKTTAEKAHAIWLEIVPDGKSFPLHMNLITFGRQICNARKPKCNECLLTDLCVYFQNELRVKN